MKNVRLISVICAVVVLHIAAFWWLSSYRPMPPREPIPAGQLEVRRSVTTDPRTGEKTIYREFTVSTKLSDPEPK